MTTHLEETLQRDIQHIQALIARMGDFTIRMLRNTVSALENADREWASLIVLRDQRVDQMEQEIDQLCLAFLVRHQPAGGHLRFSYTALQINFELERIGDYAESIARQIIKLTDLNCRAPKALFTQITSTSISMLHNAVTAFVRQDEALAGATEQIEEQVDLLRNQVNSELIHLLQTGQIPLAALTPLMTIARRFERVSDQAKSICQETIYLCTGEYAKHTATHIYRVLFVDDQHGCLSRLAEAVGRGLGRTDIEFASAGVAPKPLTPEAANLLREKGLTIQPPKRLGDLPELDEYQLVIAFSRAAKDSLPAPSRKAVHLQWSLPEPCLPEGSPQQVREAFENAYRTLSDKISGLVGKLLGEDRGKDKNE